MLTLVLIPTALGLNCSGWEGKIREEEAECLYLYLCQFPQESQDLMTVPDLQDVTALEASWSMRQLAAPLHPASARVSSLLSVMHFPPGSCRHPHIGWMDSYTFSSGSIGKYLLHE